MMVTYAASATPGERLKLAIDDVAEGLLNWRSWGILAANDVRQRYRRSRLGPFWITISMGITILGTGLVFGAILKQPMSSYLPFLAASFIAWSLLSSLVNDLAVAFIANESYLRSYPGSRSIMLFRTIARNVIQYGHNLLIIPVLWLLFPVKVTFATLLIIPATALCIVNAVWVGLLIATLSARFRDLPQILAQLMGLMFFFTPILFRPSDLRAQLPELADYNPFHYAVEILRAPLLGETPEDLAWIVMLALTLVGYTVALPFFARFRGRINYWV